jgi:hypothetical protein
VHACPGQKCRLANLRTSSRIRDEGNASKQHRADDA